LFVSTSKAVQWNPQAGVSLGVFVVSKSAIPPGHLRMTEE